MGEGDIMKCEKTIPHEALDEAVKFITERIKMETPVGVVIRAQYKEVVFSEGRKTLNFKGSVGRAEKSS